MTKEQYTEKYKNLLRARWRYDHDPFIELVQQGDLTLVCFCTPDDDGHLFCHRQIAAEVLTTVADYVGISAEYVGETCT